MTPEPGSGTFNMEVNGQLCSFLSTCEDGAGLCVAGRLPLLLLFVFVLVLILHTKQIKSLLVNDH